MAGKPETEKLKNQTAAAGKQTADGVLRALKIGNGLVSFAAGLLAMVLILYSGYVLYDSFATEYGAYTSSWDLLKYKPSTAAAQPSGESPSLKDINTDYRAWLTINNSMIDYPVVQGRDNLYYAIHDVYQKSSLTGAIYLDAMNDPNITDSYSVIYGHHMDNGAMFGSLDRYKEANYFWSHQTGMLTTQDGRELRLRVFAVATTDAYENQIYTTGNRAKEVKAFLTGSRSKDVGVGTEVLFYDSANASRGSQIVALSTCADAETNGRLVVFAVVEEKTQPVTLTVYYQYENGTTAYPTEVHVYEIGGRYYVVAPQIPGYEPSIELIRGTILEDTVVTIVYRPKEYTLTIRYRLLDGTEVLEPIRVTIRAGEEYDYGSPEISGYIAIRVRVNGANPGRDEQYTVLYVPDDSVIIPEEKTPLYPGITQIHMGICFE